MNALLVCWQSAYPFMRKLLVSTAGWAERGQKSFIQRPGLTKTQKVKNCAHKLRLFYMRAPCIGPKIQVIKILLKQMKQLEQVLLTALVYLLSIQNIEFEKLRK